MKATLKRELKLKDGRVYVKGLNFEVSMIPSSDTMAQAVLLGGLGEEAYTPPIKIRSVNLGKYFKGFIKFNIENLEDYMENGNTVCKSLTGEEVEPDGEDEYGFPSVLRAAGYI